MIHSDPITDHAYMSSTKSTRAVANLVAETCCSGKLVLHMTQRDRMRLAVETGVALRTIIKWERGGAVRQDIDKKLLRAVSELGIMRENEFDWSTWVKAND